MTSNLRINRAVLAAGLFLVCAPLAQAGQQAEPAAASQTAAAAQPSRGPLVLERVKSGFVAAPDIKVTDIDNGTGTILGGFGGWLHDETFLLGGGGYWLVNGPNRTDMMYLGLVVGWYAPVGDQVRFGARGLVGGGYATLTDSFPVSGPNRPRTFGDWTGMNGGHTGDTVVRQFRWDQGFLVFEPEVDVLVRVTDWMRFNAGVGYRVIGAANGFENRLRGVTGSVALVFGGGS